MAYPVTVVLHQASQSLQITFDDGADFALPAEFLRVHSPSAEVQGHGPGQETLQVGKAAVRITGLTPVGNYAIQPTFSDGHSSGIFTWDFLHFLGTNQSKLWLVYLNKLVAAGAMRGQENLSNDAMSSTAVSRTKA